MWRTSLAASQGGKQLVIKINKIEYTNVNKSSQLLDITVIRGVCEAARIHDGVGVDINGFEGHSTTITQGDHWIVI